MVSRTSACPPDLTLRPDVERRLQAVSCRVPHSATVGRRVLGVDLVVLVWCRRKRHRTDTEVAVSGFPSFFVKEEVRVLVPGPESNSLKGGVGLDWVYLIVFTY